MLGKVVGKITTLHISVRERGESLGGVRLSCVYVCVRNFTSSANPVCYVSMNPSCDVLRSSEGEISRARDALLELSQNLDFFVKCAYSKNKRSPLHSHYFPAHSQKSFSFRKIRFLLSQRVQGNFVVFYKVALFDPNHTKFLPSLLIVSSESSNSPYLTTILPPNRVAHYF